MSSSESTKSRTTSGIIKVWFFNSPSDGIRRIGQAKRIATSIFWGYIFWISTVLMGGFIYVVIVNYIAHPTKIHLSVQQYRDPVHFPAITFCNINPLQENGFSNDVRNSRLPGPTSSKALNEAEYRKAVFAYIDRILAEQVNGEKHPFVKWGFTLNDLLVTCTYNKRLCHRNLTQLFHPNYGNCYTFDNDQHVQLEEINDSRHDWSINNNHGDDNYKLFLELYLHQEQYIEFLNHRAAFRIFIHQKHEVPILSQNSLFIGPNKFTKLSFSQRIMSFSRHCRNDLTDYMKQIFLTHQVRYTQALCYKLCEQRFIVKHCQCIEPTLAVFYQFFNDNGIINNNKTKLNISLCSIDNQCFTSRNHFNSSELCRECLPECEIIQYSVQSSYATYPNGKARQSVSERVKNHFRLGRELNPDLYTLDYRPTDLQDNILAVEISASRYPTEILTESPMYTWVDVISSVGGQTTLWIGISLISFVEIIEVLYTLLNHFCSYIFFCEMK